jgi:polygalacturonase
MISLFNNCGRGFYVDSVSGQTSNNNNLGTSNVTSCALAPTSNTVISVKTTGAKGDGITNDTDAIQTAINQVNDTGGTVFVPAGIYMIDGTKSLKLGSNMTLQLDPSAVLQVIATSASTYYALSSTGSNINIVGGTITGDRKNHLGTGGEWGMGIYLSGTTNVVIENTTVNEMWGDGVYITGAAKSTTICGLVADHNRRQGMSVIYASGVIVKNSTFKNTQGTSPQSGIDIEPNANNTVDNVQITDSKFTGNQNNGFMIYGGSGPVTNVIVDGSDFANNGGYAVGLFQGSSNITISNNVFGGGTTLDKGTNNIFTNNQP